MVELHGAGNKRRHDLELSTGRNKYTDPLAFGRQLAPHLDPQWTLAVQTQPGTREAFLLSPDHGAALSTARRLDNPALSTASLSYAGELSMFAFHLEMKAFFRQPDPGFPLTPRPTTDAWRLSRALARAIQAFL